MKKILHTIFVLLATCLTAQAQEITGKGIALDRLSTEITGETLDIRFTVRASNLWLDGDGQLKLEFAVESGDHRLILPVVVYSGQRRYHYERRREELSGGYHAEPYHIYKGVRKDYAYELDYRLSVPYSAWMERASITYREYLHDCQGDYEHSRGVLLSALNPVPAQPEAVQVVEAVPVVETATAWRPNPAFFPHLVSFLTPEVEEVKARASMLELNIGFPVNVTEVRPLFGNNVYELSRADSLVGMLQSNTLIAIHAVTIRGYASPEGPYANNDRLARGRSEGFKQYLVGQYPYNAYVRHAHTSWVPEDWEGVERLVESHYGISRKPEVLAIVRNPVLAPDAKDQRLKEIQPWSGNYGILLNEIYPKLRRIELRVDYTIQNLTDAQARELLYANPSMLSMDEMLRVARFYEPGSRQYREVYEIAARQFPDDVVANHNAAAALLQEGRAEAALPYLRKTASDPRSLLNAGTYYYILGDLNAALECFNKAKEAGIAQAEHNLRLVNPSTNTNR